MNCPTCGYSGAYVGIIHIECANSNCIHYCPPKKTKGIDVPRVRLFSSKTLWGVHTEAEFEGYGVLRLPEPDDNNRKKTYSVFWKSTDKTDCVLKGYYVTVEREDENIIIYSQNFPNKKVIGPMFNVLKIEFEYDTINSIWEIWDKMV